jgi:P pilus assembly chaperone PapD
LLDGSYAAGIMIKRPGRFLRPGFLFGRCPHLSGLVTIFWHDLSTIKAILDNAMLAMTPNSSIIRSTIARSCLAILAPLAALLAWSPAAYAAGDLLVAPTRVILDSRRGTQIVLNNIGNEETTYRISLVLRRMNGDGKLAEVESLSANDKEKSVLSTIRFAPKRVTLPPNQPQSIRIGVQGTETLADGEYRAHLLFQAIPKPRDVTKDAVAGNEIKIQLIPIYGISIPIIVRKGALKATAAIANARIGNSVEGAALMFDLQRTGDKSVFGEVHVTKPGEKQPVIVAKAIAVYPEIGSRKVILDLDPTELAKLKGSEAVISYYESSEAGGGLITQLRTVLK